MTAALFDGAAPLEVVGIDGGEPVEMVLPRRVDPEPPAKPASLEVALELERPDHAPPAPVPLSEAPVWTVPPGMVSPWDPEHRDQRPCEILPTAPRDRRWAVVAVLSALILGGTAALLGLVS